MYVHKQWKLKNCVKWLDSLQQEMGTSRSGSVVSGCCQENKSLLSQPRGGGSDAHRQVSASSFDLGRPQEGQSWGRQLSFSLCRGAGLEGRMRWEVGAVVPARVQRRGSAGCHFEAGEAGCSSYCST